jgi:hypothetical protein
MLVIKLFQISTYSSPWKITGSLAVSVNKTGERTFYQSVINHSVPKGIVPTLPTLTTDDYRSLAEDEAFEMAEKAAALATQESRKRAASGRRGGNVSRKR